MATPLDAIYEELRRLQLEGVDRVFISEDTIVLLQPRPTTARTPAKLPPTAQKSDETAAALHEAIQSVAGDAPSQQRRAESHKPSLSHTKPIPEPPAVIKLPEGDAETRMQWLRERVENCPVCNEHLSPEGKVVFGAGAVDADIFFCGEAPGADEELAGEPFVGKAGQLLTKIIQSMGLNRESVYIGNILKWRPEHDKPYGNRPPTLEEMHYCLPYLKAQIEIVQPKVVVALGNTAVTGLLGHDPNRRMGTVRGTWHTFEGIPLMITFHPSYLLRNNTMKTKRMVWEDMLKVMEKVGLPVSEKQRGYFLAK